MRFQHALPPSAFPRGYALLSGLVISLGYLSGGIVPLLPYLFMPTIDGAFGLSIVVTALVLVLFGAAKTWFVGETARWKVLRGGAEMLVLGGTAAGAAVGCVKAFS
jgi:vacuolar iron transporter family protein